MAAKKKSSSASPKKKSTSAKKKSAEAEKKKAPRRSITAVILDARLHDPSGEWELPDVFLQLFSYTDALTLRGDEIDVKYQAGDYDKEGKHVWRGRIARVREMLKHEIRKDDQGRNVFVDKPGSQATEDATSYFAYHEGTGVLLFRDTSDFPFTRLVSYVQAALMVAQTSEKLPADLSITLRPREVRRTVKQWFKKFDRVTTLRLKYGHSRSPGSRAVDEMVEAYDAREIRETVVAESDDKGLNTKGLLNPEFHIAHAIEHLEVNPNNGSGELEGFIGDEKQTVSTRKEPEKRFLSVDWTRRGILGALVEAVLSILPRGDDDDE